ncbi:MAG: hypothetical protein ACHQNA_06145, partial [Acidimicrobiales bacterium]
GIDWSGVDPTSKGVTPLIGGRTTTPEPDRRTPWPLIGGIAAIAVIVIAGGIALSGGGGGHSSTGVVAPPAEATTTGAAPAAPTETEQTTAPTETAPTTAAGTPAASSDSLVTGPLLVRFVQAEFATHYTVVASDRDGYPLTYTWTLDPPAVDLPCNNHGVLHSSTAEFIWHHGDQDDCNHNVQGPTGHKGSVGVVVSDGHWTCEGSYFGTEGSNGSPDATAPLACSPSASG